MSGENQPTKINAVTTALLAAAAVLFAAAVALFSFALVFFMSAENETPPPEGSGYEAVYEKYKYNAVEVRDEVRELQATAFVYTVSGGDMYLFTNYHVSSDDASRLRARFYGKNSFYEEGKIELVGYSAEYDAALLKTRLFPNNPYVDIHGENAVQTYAPTGGEILCLGNNLGYGIQAQNGLVSADSLVLNPLAPTDTATSSNVIAVIGACAPLNSGNSGAPVLDLNGKLVGMNTWRVDYNSANKPVDSTCYLTPAPVLSALYANLVLSGIDKDSWALPFVQMKKGENGTLRIQDIRATFAFVDYKLTVKTVEALGTRELSEGDVIKKFGSVEVKPCNFPSLVGELFMYNPAGRGRSLTLTVERGGREITVSIDSLKGVLS